MLVYYDPWLAGVVFPSVILGGLMALPYIDFNKKGNGYYTFNERKFAVSVFLFGFLPLWVGMIILGTFLRGPNWNMFGIYEFWDVHKLEALNNINLADYFWGFLGMALPENILLREAPGILLTLGYLVFMPQLMAATCFRTFAYRMGFIRYMVFANLVLMMAALPIKMVSAMGVESEIHRRHPRVLLQYLTLFCDDAADGRLLRSLIRPLARYGRHACN